jgi:uncharacterized protein involved in exopolysaccharide biosynthesis
MMIPRRLLVRGGVIAVGTAVLAVAATRLLPATYESRATIVIPIDTPVSSQASIPILGIEQANPLDYLKGVMRSTRVITMISRQTKLSRKEVSKMLVVQPIRSEGRLVILARASRPQTAYGVARAALDSLSKVGEGIGLTAADRELKEIEDLIGGYRAEYAQMQKQIVSARGIAPMDDSGDTVRTYLKATNDLDQARARETSLQAQLRAIKGLSREAIDARVPEVAGLDGQYAQALKAYTDKQVEVANLEIEFGPDSPQLRKATAELALAKKAFDLVESRRRELLSRGVGVNMAGPFTELQAVQAQIKVLERAVRQAETSLNTADNTFLLLTAKREAVQALLKQREELSIRAAASRRIWEVLDEPELPMGATGRDYARNGLLGLVIGLGLASISVLRRSNRSGSPELAA